MLNIGGLCPLTFRVEGNCPLCSLVSPPLVLNQLLFIINLLTTLIEYLTALFTVPYTAKHPHGKTFAVTRKNPFRCSLEKFRGLSVCHIAKRQHPVWKRRSGHVRLCALLLQKHSRENFRGRLKIRENRESFPTRMFCRVRYIPYDGVGHNRACAQYRLCTEENWLSLYLTSTDLGLLCSYLLV